MLTGLFLMGVFAIGGAALVLAQHSGDSLSESLPTEQTQPPESDLLKPYDQVLAETADIHPGFGGLSVDPSDTSIVDVYMADTSQRTAAEEIARSYRENRDISEVRVLQGQYTITQLLGWFYTIDGPILDIPGTNYIASGSGGNRLSVLVHTDEAKAAVYQVLQKYNVPEDAVVVNLADGPNFLLAESVEVTIP